MNPLIYAAALYSRDVYPPRPGQKNKPIHAVERVWETYIESTDTHAKAYSADEHLGIAIQGTAEAADWRTNFKVLKECFYGISAHRGFAGAARSLLPWAEDLVRDSDCETVLITGHSLGGAVAVLVALGIQEYMRARGDRRRLLLVTFGQPKVSTGASISKALFCQYIRVVNGSDLVPRRPNVPLYYGHAGTCVYTPNRGRMLIDPSIGEMAKDRALTFFERLRDHNIDDYISELEKNP